jgi:hypothetical protein
VIRGHFRAVFPACFAALLGACRENLSPPLITPSGPDTIGPSVSLSPGSDTLVDSTGTLQVRVVASDPSGIKRIEFSITPAAFTFSPISWSDTLFDGSFPIPLTGFKHSTFSFSASVIDQLDRRTDTPGVTVTVR